MSAPMSVIGSDQDNSTPVAPLPPKQATKGVSAQKSIDIFWRTFTSKHPGKAFTVLPDDLYAKRAAILASRKPASSKNAVASYEQAVDLCRAKVDKIVHDCRRLNRKYRDPHFDIEFDFMQWQLYGSVQNCLVGLDEDNSSLMPLSVKRIEDIFDDPHFYVDGMAANDVRQGRNGDCWFMSSICTLSNKEDLLEKVCIARDEQVGVYGFVFHRDGEWISEVIDDKLYLTKQDFHESFFEQYEWLTIDIPSPDDEYRKVMQMGSKALYFAQCKDQNETWLPLLEKAYAKAHGDYGAISGGWVGEGLEDLTGGVTSELFASDILDKDKFWTDELMNVNNLFLFGLTQMGGVTGERSGIVEKHAYSIMEARELDDCRLLKIRNPWGKKEWDGAWSDGSEEWTASRMSSLSHRFGNDGVFWISYKDLLKNFQHIDRTRLFGPDWSIVQQWTSINVPWSVNYLDTHFRVRITEAGPVVIVLSQLDDRYFRGLEGEYSFQLQFRLHKDGDAEYVARNNPAYFMYRSVTTELELEAGEYSVMIKVIASRNRSPHTPEQVIKKSCRARSHKLMSIGLSYDLAHAKGRLKEDEVERQERLRRERRDERKLKARKAFEAERNVKKKEKLRRLRLEAKEGAKKGNGKDVEKIDEEAQGSTKLAEGAVQSSIPKESGEVGGKNKDLSKNPVSEQPKSTPQAPDAAEKDEGQPAVNTKDPSKGTELESQTETEKAPTADVEVACAAGKDGTAGEQPVAKPGDPSAANSTETVGKTDDPKTEKATIPIKKLARDDISDDGLSWSSDIDAPSDSSSESDADSDVETPTSPAPASSEPAADDFESAPWNAVCVVGLRIYAKGSQAEIKVVRKQDEDSVGKEKLDVDDQAADATKELQKGNVAQEKLLDAVGSADQDAEEESKQG